MTPRQRTQLARNHKRVIKHKLELKSIANLVMDAVGVDGLNKDGDRRFNNLIFRINQLSVQEIDLNNRIKRERLIQREEDTITKNNNV